jgi:hypothetical protein
MKCPECGAWTLVKETRNGTKRKRECANLHRFWTQESFVALIGRSSTRLKKDDVLSTLPRVDPKLPKLKT